MKEFIVNNTISYNNILDITNAFQIASGQGYANERTQKILDFLENKGCIHITNMPNNEEIHLKNSEDLAKLYKSIDEYINIKYEPMFARYFQG